MPQGQGLAELRQRKKELLLESDINRQILNLELCQLRLKATEWQHNLVKARNAYKWIAPLAGVAFGAFAMRKQLKGHGTDGRHRGNGSVKSTALKMMTPIAFAMLRKAFTYWRARKRSVHP